MLLCLAPYPRQYRHQKLDLMAYLKKRKKDTKLGVDLFRR